MQKNHWLTIVLQKDSTTLHGVINFKYHAQCKCIDKIMP